MYIICILSTDLSDPLEHVGYVAADSSHCRNLLFLPEPFLHLSFRFHPHLTILDDGKGDDKNYNSKMTHLYGLLVDHVDVQG